MLKGKSQAVMYGPGWFALLFSLSACGSDGATSVDAGPDSSIPPYQQPSFSDAGPDPSADAGADPGEDAGEDAGIDQDLTGIAQRIHLLRGHTGEVTCVAFSPDGMLAATGSRDDTAKLWNVATGDEVHALTGHAADVVSVRFDSQGQQLVTGDAAGNVRIWNASTGTLVRTLMNTDEAAPALDVASDGSVVAVAHGDFTTLWDVATGQRLWRSAYGGPKVAFSHLGVVVGGAGQIAHLFLTDGTLASSPPQETDYVIRQYLLEGGYTLTLDEFFYPEDFMETVVGDGHMGHSRKIHEFLMSSDDQHTLTASDDSTAKVWFAENGIGAGTPVRTFEHRGPVNAVDLSPDTEIVLTGSDDMTAALWWRARGTVVRYLNNAHDVAFYLDGKYALFATESSLFRTSLAPHEFEDGYYAGEGILAVALAADGGRVVVGREDGVAEVLHGLTLQAQRSLAGHSGAVQAVALGAADFAVTGSADGTAILWNAATGASLRTLEAHEAGVSAVAISPDGTKVLTAGNDGSIGTAKLWERSTGVLLRTFEERDINVEDALFTPDGKNIVTRVGGEAAMLWNAATGEQIRTFASEGYEVNGIAISPNGKMLLTSGTDGHVRAYNVATGEEILYAGGPLYEGSDLIEDLAVSPDGKRFLVGRRGGATSLLVDMRPVALE